MSVPVSAWVRRRSLTFAVVAAGPRTFAIMSGHDEFCQRTAQIGGRQHTITPLTRPQAAAKASTFLAPSAAAARPTSARPKDPTARGLGAAAGDRPISWGATAGDLLGWLLAGRRSGPVFLTDRRAPAGTRASDLCQFSGCGRMSYRRAAEILAEHTRQLDPAGCGGWTLYQLRRPPSG